MGDVEARGQTPFRGYPPDLPATARLAVTGQFLEFPPQTTLEQLPKRLAPLGRFFLRRYKQIIGKIDGDAHVLRMIAQRYGATLLAYPGWIVGGREMARPERLELPTYWFVASRSIQLSYGRARD